MSHDFIERIKKWRNIAEKQEDFFVKFALEYFAFNALIRIAYYPDRNAVRDRDLIEKLKGDEICMAEFLSNNKNWIDELKGELDRKPLQNLTRNKELKIENQEDWNNIVEAVYWIRNNLFHGYKNPGDGRDQKLVEIGYCLLSGFNDYFISKKEGGNNA